LIQSIAALPQPLRKGFAFPEKPIDIEAMSQARGKASKTTSSGPGKPQAFRKGCGKAAQTCSNTETEVSDAYFTRNIFEELSSCLTGNSPVCADIFALHKWHHRCTSEFALSPK
jgi:hypothetical protein